MSKFKVYINSEHFNLLVNLVYQYNHERFVCLMGNVEKIGKSQAIVIKEMQVLEDVDYDGLYTTLCRPKSSVIEQMMQRIQQKRYSVYIEYHTHPLDFPHFSETDKADEKKMWNYFQQTFPNKYYGNMMLDINGRGQAVIRDWHDGKLKEFDAIPY